MKKDSKKKPGCGHPPVGDEVLAAFLENLCEYGNVSKSASMAGVARTTVYRYRSDDPKFAAAWDEAEKIGVRALEDEARRRGFEGWVEPVYNQGRRVMDVVLDPDTGLPLVNAETGEVQMAPAVVRKYSDTLLIFLMKGNDPDKFKDRAHTEHSAPGGGPIKVDLSGLPLSDLRELKRIMDKARTSGGGT